MADARRQEFKVADGKWTICFVSTCAQAVCESELSPDCVVFRTATLAVELPEFFLTGARGYAGKEYAADVSAAGGGE